MTELENLKEALKKFEKTKQEISEQTPALMELAIKVFREKYHTDVIFFNAYYTCGDKHNYDLFCRYSPNNYQDEDAFICAIFFSDISNTPLRFDIRTCNDEYGTDGEYFEDVDTYNINYDDLEIINAIVYQIDNGQYFDLENNVLSALAYYYKETGKNTLKLDKDNFILNDAIATADIDGYASEITFDKDEFYLTNIKVVDNNTGKETDLEPSEIDGAIFENAEDLCWGIKKQLNN